MRRGDPGPCLICGAPHCSCGGGPIAVVQLPARDASVARTLPDPPLGPSAPAGVVAGAGGSALLGDGSDGRPFSTATYRGKKKR